LLTTKQQWRKIHKPETTNAKNKLKELSHNNYLYKNTRKTKLEAFYTIQPGNGSGQILQLPWPTRANSKFFKMRKYQGIAGSYADLGSGS